MQPQAVHLTAFIVSDKSIDGQAVQALVRRIRRPTSERSQHKVRLDFRQVEFVTASGLGQLVALHQQLRALGGRLTLANMRPMLYEVFVVTHLTSVLDVRLLSIELPASAARRVPTPEVLVVENDEHVRRLLDFALRQFGFGVRLAGSGVEAVQIYTQHQATIGLVLLDVQMPDGLDGPQTFAALRGLNPCVRAMFMSGNTGRDTAEQLLASGAVRVLSKPFSSLTDLSETLRQAIHSTEGADRL